MKFLKQAFVYGIKLLFLYIGIVSLATAIVWAFSIFVEFCLNFAYVSHYWKISKGTLIFVIPVPLLCFVGVLWNFIVSVYEVVQLFWTNKFVFF